MKRLYQISLGAIALCISGCGQETSAPRSPEWYSANPEQRTKDSAACLASPPASEVGKQNCKNAEASEVLDLVKPNPVRIR